VTSLRWLCALVPDCVQPISKELIFALAPVAFCHALGHVMTNVSFASVAVSFTHTVKCKGHGCCQGCCLLKHFCKCHVSLCLHLSGRLSGSLLIAVLDGVS